MTEVKQNGVKLPDARVRAATPGDEIVICGVSGKFPNAENVAEFARKLYNKVRKCQLSCGLFSRMQESCIARLRRKGVN